MKQYQNLLQELLKAGNERNDRTGTGTLSKFGCQMRFDLQNGFPLLTTKKLHIKAIIHELLWMLSGDTNIKYLNDNGVSIWDEWADENGDLGAVYGKQWRAWDNCHKPKLKTGVFPGKRHNIQDSNQFEGIDQIAYALDQIKNNPDSRRIVVTAWNPADMDNVRLHWCHCLFQFYVHNGKLSCQLYQRSADCFLGVPFNIASYALLTHMMAQQANLGVGEFIWTGGDTHLYLNHIEQANEQLTREPRELPMLMLNKADSILDYKISDFEFVGYNPHPSIKAKVAV